MPTIMCNLSALVVASLFYYWRTYHQGHERQVKILRERVSYLLWAIAQTV